MTSFCHHVIPKMNQIISRHLKKIDRCIWQIKKHNFHFSFQWLDEIFIYPSTKIYIYNILHEVGKSYQFCSNNEFGNHQFQCALGKFSLITQNGCWLLFFRTMVAIFLVKICEFSCPKTKN